MHRSALSETPLMQLQNFPWLSILTRTTLMFFQQCLRQRWYKQDNANSSVCWKSLQKLNLEIPKMNWFSRIPLFRPKRTVSLCVFGKKKMLRFTRISWNRVIPLILLIHCILPKAHSFILHFHQKRLIYVTRRFHQKAKFCSAFLLETHDIFRKCAVYKTTLIFTSRFWCVLSYSTRFRR